MCVHESAACMFGCSGFPPEFGVLLRLAEIGGRGDRSSHTCQTSEVLPVIKRMRTQQAKEPHLQHSFGSNERGRPGDGISLELSPPGIQYFKAIFQHFYRFLDHFGEGGGDTHNFEYSCNSSGTFLAKGHPQPTTRAYKNTPPHTRYSSYTTCSFVFRM